MLDKLFSPAPTVEIGMKTSSSVKAQYNSNHMVVNKGTKWSLQILNVKGMKAVMAGLKITKSFTEMVIFISNKAGKMKGIKLTTHNGSSYRYRDRRSKGMEFKIGNPQKFIV